MGRALVGLIRICAIYIYIYIYRIPSLMVHGVLQGFDTLERKDVFYWNEAYISKYFERLHVQVQIQYCQPSCLQNCEAPIMLLNSATS